MVGEVNILTEWIPEQMQPGTIFVLENAGDVGEGDDPYWAVLACPGCGTLGLITRRQDPLDGRRTFVALTTAAVASMDAYFDAIGQTQPL